MKSVVLSLNKSALYVKPSEQSDDESIESCEELEKTKVEVSTKGEQEVETLPSLNNTMLKHNPSENYLENNFNIESVPFKCDETSFLTSKSTVS